MLVIDILVAPVFLENKNQWDVYLPGDEWIYLWNGTEISVPREGRNILVNAEVGNPPVFYRKNSKWSDLLQKFASCKNIFVTIICVYHLET